jgi:hypothetical protein
MSHKNEVPLCGHVKTNGAQCKSPALRHSYYCYFHERLHERHRNYRRTEASKAYLLPGVHIQLHALEDAESVQLAISMVVNALATGALEPKRATPLLYGLQLASINLSRLSSQPKPHDIVRDVTTTPDGVDRSCHYNSISLDPAPAPMERKTTPTRTLALPPGQDYEDNS